jgi:hypothetical protein
MEQSYTPNVEARLRSESKYHVVAVVLIEVHPGKLTPNAVPLIHEQRQLRRVGKEISISVYQHRRER